MKIECKTQINNELMENDQANDLHLQEIQMSDCYPPIKLESEAGNDECFDVQEEDMPKEQLFEIISKLNQNQIFPENKAEFASSKCIKSKEIDKEVPIKSELHKKFLLHEGHVNIDARFANLTMIGKEANDQQLMKSDVLTSDADFLLDEEKFFAKLINSEFPLVLVKKLSDEEVESFINDVREGKYSEEESSLRSRSPRSVTVTQQINENSYQNFICKYCNFNSKNQSEFENHLITQRKRELQCTHCSYTSCCTSNLEDHLLNHNQNLKIDVIYQENIKLFKCSRCNYLSKQKGNLKKHMLIHMDIKLFRCTECSYECNQKENLKKHIAIHQKIKLFRCGECGYECYQKVNLKKHMLIHWNIKLFKCGECNFECNQKTRLKKHMLKHRNVLIKLIKCSECNTEVNSKIFQRHKRKCFNKNTTSDQVNIPQESNAKVFKCDENIIHGRPTELFKCSECNYECNIKVNLDKHMLNHESTQPSCFPEIFPTSNKGDILQRRHKKPFKCTECNYRSNQKGNLNKHKLTHGGIKLFKCSDCSYECKQKGSLIIHMLKHSNKKIFRCDECSYECNHKVNLKTHKLNHGNKALYKCSKCGYKSNHKGNFKIHMLIHEDKKLFKCYHCGYECNLKSSLKKHMLRHKSIE